MKIKRFWKNFFSFNNQEHKPDNWLLISVGILLVFGLIMLSSASSVVSYAKYGNTYHYFFKQLFYVFLGLIAFFIFYKIDYRFWRRYAIWALFFSIFLLILVFIPGLKADYGSAQSWIKIFGQSLQPSEFVKISFLIYLATWLEIKNDQLNKANSGIIPFLISLAIISILIMAQPDLGTLFIILFAAFASFFVAGGKFSHIIITILLGVFSLALFFYFNSSYQTDRFKCYQNPDYDSQEECYQINQSLIAVGSGGWFGRGLGQSRQKFMYLPEVWSDAIFPIIAEEIGFIFSVFLILLYGFFFYRGFRIARYSPDIYGSALATGIVAWLAVQTFLNIGGMINLIPMTGVPLPFISAGGSSILSSLIAIGILANISKHIKYGRF